MKTTKEWSKMLLTAMAAMVLAFGLVLVGCDDGSDNGGDDSKSGTVKMADIGSNKFTLTLTGGLKWETGLPPINFGVFALDGTPSGSITSTSHIKFEVTAQTDTELTVTMSKASTFTGTGKVKLTDPATGWWEYVQDSYIDNQATVTVAADSASANFSIS